MKTLNEYLALPYRMEIVEDREEGGYVVSYPDLPGCLTCGETIESAVENARDAKRVWLEAALDDLTVACADGGIQLLQVVPEGKKPMDGTSFAAGLRLKTGDVL